MSGTSSWARRAAWATLALTLGATAVAGVFLWLNRSTLAYSEGADAISPFMGAAGYGTIGAIIAANRPTHPIGWLLVAVGGTYAVPLLASEWAIWLAGRGTTSPVLGFLQGSVVASVAIATLIAVAVLFPQGRVPGRRWRIGLVVVVFALTVDVAIEPFFPATPRFRDPGITYQIEAAGDSEYTVGQIVDGRDLRAENAALSGSGLQPADGLAWLAPALVGDGSDYGDLVGNLQFLLNLVAFLPLMAAASVRLVLLGRRSSGAVRQQMKWLSYAVAVTLGLVVLSATGVRYLEDLNLVASVVLAFGVPGAIAVAVTRHGLYEIDRIINRTVVYAVVVGALAAVFAGGVSVASSVLPTGSGNLGVAGSTLAVAALFNPLRRRVQSAVDRRFNRSRYDANRIADEFSTKMRNLVDPAAVGHEWAEVVTTAMRPAAVGVWVRGER